jgi:DNA-directed RNA polymerase specialized sigma24 family protein
MYPTQHQWALLEAYKQYPRPLSPLQFLQIYDELSYRELATILGLSISSVEHFLCDRTSSGYRECAQKHCRTLAEIHVLWKHSAQLTPELIQAWCQYP